MNTNPVILYTRPFCPYCTRAKALLAQVGADNVQEINIDGDNALFEEMLARSNGGRTVPQIFIGDTHVGGFTDMAALHQQGGLLPLLGIS